MTAANIVLDIIATILYTRDVIDAFNAGVSPSELTIRR
jgi:hypothetical protein